MRRPASRVKRGHSFGLHQHDRCGCFDLRRNCCFVCRYNGTDRAGLDPKAQLARKPERPALHRCQCGAARECWNCNRSRVANRNGAWLFQIVHICPSSEILRQEASIHPVCPMSADGGQRRERLRLELRLIEGELRTDEALRIPIHRHPSVTANHAAAMASLNPPIGCPHSPERSRSSPAVTQTRPPFHRSVAFPMSIIARTPANPAKPRETSQNLAKVATGQFSPSNRPNFDPPPYSRWCEKPPQTLWGGVCSRQPQNAPAGRAESARRHPTEGEGRQTKAPRAGAGLGGSIVCVAITGLAVPSETQQAHHLNAEPHRWLHGTQGTRTKKPARVADWPIGQRADMHVAITVGRAFSRNFW